MSYQPPIKTDEKWIELGGGATPRLRPNCDIRPGPSVDVVWDFSQPSPLADSQFDGVLCVYAVEHVSWRRLVPFLGEVHRILKPGGVACFLTADLYAQARQAVERGPDAWRDTYPAQMLLGDQDYPENSHKSAFSRESAVKLCKQAGFYEVATFDLEQCGTDFWFEARKSAAVIMKGW